MSLPAAKRVSVGDKAAVAGCHSLLVGRARWLQERGIDQWGVLLGEPVATEILMSRVAQHEVYLWEDEVGPVATVCLQGGDELVWPKDGVAALYLHGIATRVGVRGVGVEVMAWAEELARGRAKTHMRLDCVADNPRLLAYYAGLGYESRGDCTPYGPEWRIRRWEKRL